MFLLDTNVVSEMRKTRLHGALFAWYAAQAAHALFIPSVALYELQAGVETTRQQDYTKAIQIEEWIDRIVETGTILHLDAESARLTAKFLHGRSPEFFEDAMIAAIAAANRLTVATRNISDFKQFGVATVNPFADLR